MNEDPLVLATYGLVIATGLLVLASAVPAVMAILESRRRRATGAARVVPDLNMLLSRLRGQANSISRLTQATLPQLDVMLGDIEIDMRHAHNIMKDAPAVGLKFTNEMYLTRHFITCAADDLRLLARRAEEATGRKSQHELRGIGSHTHQSSASLSEEARLSKVSSYLLAGASSLSAAEGLLPRKVRTVDGTPFWDRYSSEVDKRIDSGEKELVDLRKRNRSRAK